MDKKTIYSKTGKGVLEIKNKSGKLSRDLVKVLTLIDGKSSVSDLISKSRLSDADMDRAISNLSDSGYIKEFSNTSAGVRNEPGESSYVDDLDFTSSLSPSKNVYQSAQTEWRNRESSDRVKAEQEARKKREDEERLKKERDLRQARDEAAKMAKIEAERKVKEAAALKQREEAERKAKIEADLMAQTQRDLGKVLEAERKALEQSERKRQDESSGQARLEAERRNREDADRKRREEEDKKRRQEEEGKRREEEDRKRKEEEERRRREEDERKRKEEDERRRREEEEKKRREDEERRRREEEARKRQEEEERRRREDEERRHREEEEKRRREEDQARQRRAEEERRQREEEERRRRDEEEARRRREEGERSSAASAKFELPELDLSGLTSMETRVASEFEKQQEQLRQREEEEERQRAVAEQARRGRERAEREEEARLEAERREAEDRERRESMERERADREARERAREEEKQRRIKEQEERRIKAEQERAREAEMKVETARRSREEDLARRRKEQEERDRKRAEVDALKKQKAIRGPLDRLKPVFIVIVALAALVLGGIQFMPMNTYIPRVEKLASDHIGEPVTVGSMRISILGGFEVHLENVKIGLTEDFKAGSVKLTMGLGSVLGERKIVDEIEADSVTFAEEMLSRLPGWKSAAMADPNLQIGRLLLKDVKLQSRTVELPGFNADLRLEVDGTVRQAQLSTTDGKLSIELTPRGSEVDVTVSANQGWIAPVGPAIEFTDFSATAVASGSEIRVQEFSALFYGGAAKGSARINWGGPWSIVGDVKVERAGLQQLMPVFTKDAKSSGQLEANLRYAMASPALSTLFESPRIEGSFVLRKGDLDGVDLVRALQLGGRDSVQGGATRFEDIAGSVSVANGRYLYRNLRLSSGLLSGTGGFDISPSKEVSGRVAVELRSQAAQIRGNFNLTGNLKAIVLRPN